MNKQQIRLKASNKNEVNRMLQLEGNVYLLPSPEAILINLCLFQKRRRFDFEFKHPFSMWRLTNWIIFRFRTFQVWGWRTYLPLQRKRLTLSYNYLYLRIADKLPESMGLQSLWIRLLKLTEWILKCYENSNRM